MATHFSVLAWRIPGLGEPGGLPSLGLHRVGHDGSDLAAADSRESACNAGYLGSILGREYPLEKEMTTHSSVLAWKNPMDRGAWPATVHGVAKSQKRRSN